MHGIGPIPPANRAASLSSVARWPKILQNNSKGAAKNIFWPRDFGGCTAPNFDQKCQKRGWKTFSVLVFSGAVRKESKFLGF